MVPGLWLACALLSSEAAAQPTSPTLPPTPADVAKSRELFAEGRAAADNGDWRRACPLFQAANDLNRTSGTAFSLAICYDRTGQPERALPYWESIVAAGDARFPERVETAKRRVAEINAARPAPPPAPPSPTPSPTPSAGAPPRLYTLPAPLPDGPPPSRAPAYVAFGVGATGLAVGAVFTAMAFSSASDAGDRCPHGGCTDEAAKNEVAEIQADARRSGWIGVAAGGIGVAAVIAGVVLLATQGDGSTTSAGARGLKVRF